MAHSRPVLALSRGGSKTGRSVLAVRSRFRAVRFIPISVCPHSAVTSQQELPPLITAPSTICLTRMTEIERS